VRGPKGAFRVEMQRESQKDRTILCKYEPTEPGDYRIEVKWSGDHVPGSPFMVMIFDTHEELSKFLQVRGINWPYMSCAKMFVGWQLRLSGRRPHQRLVRQYRRKRRSAALRLTRLRRPPLGFAQ